MFQISIINLLDGHTNYFQIFILASTNNTPQKNPPPLSKMSSPPSNNYALYTATTTPPQVNYYNSSNSKGDKNNGYHHHGHSMDILRMIFPFFDPIALNSIFRDHDYDLLQTVLTISSYLLEKRMSSAPSKSVHHHTTTPPVDSTDNYYCRPAVSPHTPYHHKKMTSPTGRCCSSPYCPVNSYLNLRKKSPEIMQHVPTPPLTSSLSYDVTSSSTNIGGSRDHQSPKLKKFRFSTESLLPFCDSCQKFGIKGDKFCPLCGILFSD